MYFFLLSYQSPDDEYVLYGKLVDDIEEIFTKKNLEKTPLQEVTQFQPPVKWRENKLSDEMNLILDKCMTRLAEKVGYHLKVKNGAHNKTSKYSSMSKLQH